MWYIIVETVLWDRTHTRFDITLQHVHVIHSWDAHNISVCILKFLGCVSVFAWSDGMYRICIPHISEMYPKKTCHVIKENIYLTIYIVAWDTYMYLLTYLEVSKNFRWKKYVFQVYLTARYIPDTYQIDPIFGKKTRHKMSQDINLPCKYIKWLRHKLGSWLD